MKALVYHGPGKQGMGGRSGRDDPGPHRRRRPGRHHHDLRHRPAHPAGRRRRRDRRADPRPRGGRHGHRGRRRGQRVRASATGCWCRRSPSAAAASTASAACRRTARPSAASAGSSATSSTARRPSSCGCPTPTPRSTRSPRRQQRAGDLPRRLAAHRLRGRRARRAACGPGDTVAVVGAGAVGLVRDPHHRAVGRVEGDRRRHQQVPAGEGDRVRRHGRGRGRPRHGGGRDRADRRAGRRRVHRGRRLPGDAAHGGVAGAAGRHDRQHRRARHPGGAADAGHVDPERHADDGAGRTRCRSRPC